MQPLASSLALLRGLIKGDSGLYPLSNLRRMLGIWPVLERARRLLQPTIEHSAYSDVMLGAKMGSKLSALGGKPLISFDASLIKQGCARTAMVLENVKSRCKNGARYRRIESHD